VPSFGIIWACAGLGDKDQAFLVGKSYQSIETNRLAQRWPVIGTAPSDPRFHDLVRRVACHDQGAVAAGGQARNVELSRTRTDRVGHVVKPTPPLTGCLTGRPVVGTKIERGSAIATRYSPRTGS